MDVRFAIPPLVEVAGRSMEPALARGWKVRIVPTEGTPPTPGDVVLFRFRGELVLHRVVRTFLHEGRPFVFHRGDRLGRMVFAYRIAERAGLSRWPRIRAVGRILRRVLF